jgi:hypothetical protein
MGKMVRRDRKHRRGRLGVHRSLGSLTGNALASPLIDLLRHAGPEMRRRVTRTPGCPALCSLSKMLRRKSSDTSGLKRRGTRHQTGTLSRPAENNIQAGRLPHESNLGTSALSGGKGGQVRNSGNEGLGGGEGEEAAEGGAVGAEVACTAGAAFGADP